MKFNLPLGVDDGWNSLQASSILACSSYTWFSAGIKKVDLFDFIFLFVNSHAIKMRIVDISQNLIDIVKDGFLIFGGQLNSQALVCQANVHIENSGLIQYFHF